MSIHLLPRAVQIFIGACLLSACSPEPASLVDVRNDGGAAIELRMPGFLAQSRAIDPAQLRVVAALDGNELGVDCDVNARCTASTTVAANSESILTIAWFGPGNLQLAETSETISVPADVTSLSIEIVDSDYDTASFDADNDGISNLRELDSGSNPSVQEDAVVEVPVSLAFELPQGLADASEDVLASVTAVASARQTPIALSRANGVWSGTTTAVRGGEIFIRATFYASSNRLVTLAARTLTQPIEAVAVSVRFAAGEYETAFNSDGDGLSNIEEVEAGSDPLDAGDPAVDPCDISQFQTGCTTDTDEDGTPDSVEGLNADEDGDNIPDWRESAIEDSDEDGVPDQQDPANSDACNPDTDSPACDLPPEDPCEVSDFGTGCTVDTDRDEIPDSEEGELTDTDGDTVPDYLESAIADADGDDVPDQEDPADTDVCLPDENSLACLTAGGDEDEGEGEEEEEEEEEEEDEGDVDDPTPGELCIVDGLLQLCSNATQ